MTFLKSQVTVILSKWFSSEKMFKKLREKLWVHQQHLISNSLYKRRTSCCILYNFII